MSEGLRELPPVDALAAQVDAPRALAVAAARAVLA
jgi:L-seryl-tRNA(Ser) seleniumtransferase